MALQEEFESQGNFLFKYRSNLPLVIIVIGIIVFSIDRINGSGFDTFLPFGLIELICLFVCLLGLGIRIYTVGHTPANTSGRNTKAQLADELNTSGIYSTVRHPLYLGNFFMWLGIAMLTFNAWFIISFCLLYWVYYERIMYAEEQFLRRKFGEIYTQWAAHTPAFFPSFKNWKKPNYQFSWKKVIKKEKNGLLAIFVLLFIFDSIDASIQSQSIQANLNWITYCTIAIGIIYLVLKVLKRKTNLLNETGR
jgi:protein-S-isoprenylcysteine O-methyltransferase Ste14